MLHKFTRKIESIIKKSKEIDNVLKYIENTVNIIKNIYIKNKLVNFITKK